MKRQYRKPLGMREVDRILILHRQQVSMVTIALRMRTFPDAILRILQEFCTEHKHKGAYSGDHHTYQRSDV